MTKEEIRTNIEDLIILDLPIWVTVFVIDDYKITLTASNYRFVPEMTIPFAFSRINFSYENAATIICAAFDKEFFKYESDRRRKYLKGTEELSRYYPPKPLPKIRTFEK